MIRSQENERGCMDRDLAARLLALMISPLVLLVMGQNFLAIVSIGIFLISLFLVEKHANG
jgi:hypothetical protein